MEFEVSKHEEFLSRAELKKCLASTSPNLVKSPKVTKGKASKGVVGKTQKEGQFGLDDLPSAPVTDFGVTEPVMQFLEASPCFFLDRVPR